ncbi:MAG: hypothetical protein ACRCV0_02250, partial [Brevinema sp.]
VPSENDNHFELKKYSLYRYLYSPSVIIMNKKKRTKNIIQKSPALPISENIRKDSSDLLEHIKNNNYFYDQLIVHKFSSINKEMNDEELDFFIQEISNIKIL